MEEKESPGVGDLPASLFPRRSKQSFREILNDRINILREAIVEIETLINQRTKLTERFRYEIEAEIKEALHQLSFLPPPWRQGFLPDMEFLRSNLSKSLTSRKNDRRTADLKEWEDIASLLREKRKLIIEYEMLVKMAKQTGEK